MNVALRASLIGLIIFAVGCSSRSVNTELTRCVYPDSPRTPAPAFLCGAEVAGFPILALRSSELSNLATSDRIQAVLEEQILLWAEQWSLEWFETPENIAKAQTELQALLTEHARVVRSRTSPKSYLWLLIGIPFEESELAAMTKLRVTSN